MWCSAALIKQSHEEVERLLEVLQSEAHIRELQAPAAAVEGDVNVPIEYGEEEMGQRKRQDLGVFLTLQRAFPHP